MDRFQGKELHNEDIAAIIKEVVEGTIGNEKYTSSKAPKWNTSIIEGCLERLKEKNKYYKYIVTCIIMQRKGMGFYVASTVYWDNMKDASASYRYDTKSLYAIINIFALSS